MRQDSTGERVLCQGRKIAAERVFGRQAITDVLGIPMVEARLEAITGRLNAKKIFVDVEAIAVFGYAVASLPLVVAKGSVSLRRFCLERMWIVLEHVSKQR